MPFDAIAVAALRQEFTEKLKNSKIEKIYQPERDEIDLMLKTSDSHARLALCADPSAPRIHITDIAKPNPISAPMFCMLLRKHLSGGKIIDFSGPEAERVLDIVIASKNELGDTTEKHIFVEIMGRSSNLIVTDENLKILDSIRRVDLSVSSVRSILPGLTYTAPPMQDKLLPSTLSEQDIFEELLKLSGEVVAEKILVKTFAGLSPLAAREVVFRATGDTSSLLEPDKCIKIAHELYMFFNDIIKGNFSPCVLYDSQTKVATDFAAYKVTCYKNLSDVVYFDSLSLAMDAFYKKREHDLRMHRRSSSLRKVVTNNLERCRKKLILQQETLAASENAGQYKYYGELIHSSMYLLKGGEDKAFLPDYSQEGFPNVEVKLDPQKSPSQNANIYFAKYRKAKNAKEIVTQQLVKNISEIEYLESVLSALENADDEAVLLEIRTELTDQGYIKKEKGKQQKNPASTPRKFEAFGYEIYIGRNNKQNDYVTLKLGRTKDLWLHTKDIPGSHVLIKYQGEEFPDKVVEAAASLAAYYSSGRAAGKVEVDYTEIKNVHKPSGAAPGKVIYEKYKTAYVKPDINI